MFGGFYVVVGFFGGLCFGGWLVGLGFFPLTSLVCIISGSMELPLAIVTE